MCWLETLGDDETCGEPVLRTIESLYYVTITDV